MTLVFTHQPEWLLAWLINRHWNWKNPDGMACNLGNRANSTLRRSVRSAKSGRSLANCQRHCAL